MKPVSRLSMLRPACLALGLAVVASLTLPGRSGAPDASAQTGLIAYRAVAHWPERSGASAGLFQSPSDLDSGQDGRVFVADPGIGGVHLLLPSGTFTAPFGVAGGFPAQLSQVGPVAVGPDPDEGTGHEVVYVLDPGLDRVAIYGSDGHYLRQWTGIKGQGISASTDGFVYILDRATGQVRSFLAATGAERWAWGERGTEDGQLSNFSDVSVSADGKVLVVADKRGQRVQLFNVADQASLDAGGAPLALRRVYDLRDAKFTQNAQTCSGLRVNSLGGDSVFMGQGEQACLVDGRTVSFAIAASANSGTICRATVRLPSLRADTAKYFALAEYDPNLGKCGEKRQDKPTLPVVVSYSDTMLRQVDTVHRAASNDDSKDPVLFSPRQLAMSDAEHIFVADTSSVFRVFTRDGRQVATSVRDTQAGDFSTDFELFRIDRAVGAETVGEVYGFYFNIKRTGQTATQEAGVGRFKTVTKRTRNGDESVIEAIWSDPLVSSDRRRRILVGGMAFSPLTQELLTLRADTTDQTRSADVRIVRYAPDGRKLAPDWDLPDDGRTNPYSDMVVGPDGRIYLLDDLADLVRVFGPDGTPLFDVPVAFDARAVAAGPQSPDGEVFVLREPGAIERYADDGRVTARLDGRPLEFSDPTTLTDLVVDGDGRVYVADGQTSLITVLEASPDPDEIPIPDDGACLFKGAAAAAPATVDVGDPVSVTLSLAGRCGTDEEPADIVVVLPYYRQLQQGTDPSAGTITNMQRLMSRVNFSRHRVGIVSYYNTTAVELALTNDRAAYLAKTLDITRANPPNDQVKARLKDAMEEGAKLFTDPTRRRVMVLLQADYCAVATERTPGQCAGYPPAEDTALAIRQSGVTIVSVGGGGGGGGGMGFGGGGGGAAVLASSDEDVVQSVDQAHRRMVRYRLPEALATDLTLTDSVPANMTVDPAGISAGGTWQAPAIIWSAQRVPFDGLGAALRLRPTQGGTWPVSEGTTAQLTDGWGHPQTVTFPIPRIAVIGPTPTPLPLTASPVPATSTPLPPTATPTGAPVVARPVFLPIVYANRCATLAVPLEVALVLDTSSSMGAPTEPGGPTKMQAAQDAATAFVSALRAQDRVAVIGFDAAARTALPLSPDHGAARAAIAQLPPGHGTRIDLGLAAARTALAERRDGSAVVTVLLTDGRPSVAAAAVRSAAAELRAAGVELYTIGLGQDVDQALLDELPGTPGRSYRAPSADDLAGIFRGLLGRTRVICE